MQRKEVYKDGEMITYGGHREHFMLSCNDFGAQCPYSPVPDQAGLHPGLLVIHKWSSSMVRLIHERVREHETTQVGSPEFRR